MRVPHVLFALLITVAWGGNFVAVKIGLQELRPLFFAALRFGLVLLLLLPWLRWKPGHMRWIMLIALTGGPLHFGAIFLSLDLIGGAASAAMLAQLSAPFSTLLAVLFLGERVGFWRILGMSLAFTGVAVMSFDPRVFAYVDGVLVMIFSQIAYAATAILMRRLKGVSVFELQAWMALVSMPVLFSASFLFETGQWQQLSSMTMASGWALAYTVLAASILGHGGIYFLYQRYPVSTIAPFILLTPVCGVISAVLILNDTLSSRMIVGGTVIFAGVALVTWRESLRARQAGL